MVAGGGLVGNENSARSSSLLLSQNPFTGWIGLCWIMREDGEGFNYPPFLLFPIFFFVFFFLILLAKRRWNWRGGAETKIWNPHPRTELFFGRGARGGDVKEFLAELDVVVLIAGLEFMSPIFWGFHYSIVNLLFVFVFLFFKNRKENFINFGKYILFFLFIPL